MEDKRVLEKLAQGRAKIDSWADSIIVTIPSRKKLFLVVFLAAWLGGWVLGESSVLSELWIQRMPIQQNSFLLIWLIGWTAGGVWAIYTLAWNIAGKEVVTVSPSSIKIETVVFGIRRGKEYLTESVKRLRIEPGSNSLFAWNRGMEFWGLSGGIIKFDYGMKTVQFAIGVDEAEAFYLLHQIKDHINKS